MHKSGQKLAATRTYIAKYNDLKRLLDEQVLKFLSIITYKCFIHIKVFQMFIFTFSVL